MRIWALKVFEAGKNETKAVIFYKEMWYFYSRSSTPLAKHILKPQIILREIETIFTDMMVFYLNKGREKMLFSFL